MGCSSDHDGANPVYISHKEIQVEPRFSVDAHGVFLTGFKRLGMSIPSGRIIAACAGKIECFQGVPAGRQLFRLRIK